MTRVDLWFVGKSVWWTRNESLALRLCDAGISGVVSKVEIIGGVTIIQHLHTIDFMF